MHFGGVKALSLNYQYVVDLARRLSPVEQPVCLDYGCGGGELVQIACSVGLDCQGVDVFYGGGATHRVAQEAGLLGDKVLEMVDGRIPADAGTYDIVFANQVFEHIDDFTLPLSEIDRVMKPGGIFINIFPSAKVWREGHCGVPFVHWFPKGAGALRAQYMLAARCLGAGSNKYNKTCRQWTTDMLGWLDDWTFYKPLDEIERSFAELFVVSRMDHDYFEFRCEKNWLCSALHFLFRRRAIASFIASRLASHVFVLRKRDVGLLAA